MLYMAWESQKVSWKWIKYSNDGQIYYINKYHNIAENFCNYKVKVITLKHIFDQINLLPRN
jgi:surface antigen